MKLRSVISGCAIACLVLVVFLSVASDSAGQEVRLRRGDRLQLTVPQRPDLDLYLVVDNRGEIYLSIAGAVYVEGMTIELAEATILRKLREIYPSIQSITVLLTAGENIVYVHGQVVNPGKYELSVAPNVWEAVREAGGGTSDASLEAVRVIRAGGEGRRTEIVNLQRAIDSGDFESLPKLRPGDTVIVPAKAMRIEGAGAVNVFGAVTNPAPYLLSGEKTLLDAILAAGGSVEYANLSKVSIVRLLPEGGSLTMQVNFKRYLKEGDMRHNPDVRPGDTVNVPRHSYFFRTITDPTFILGIITTMVTITAITYANR